MQASKMQKPTERDFVLAHRVSDGLGYSTPRSLLRAWRSAQLPLWRRPGGQYLLDRADLGRFIVKVS